METEVVATFRYRHEAELAQQMLAAHDIFSMVAADDAGGWQPWIMADVRLIVRVADALMPAAGIGDESLRHPRGCSGNARGENRDGGCSTRTWTRM